MVWRGGQYGVVVAWVEAKDDWAAGRFFNAEALSANGHASIGADFKGGAHAPNIIQPGAKGSWTQGGTFFLFSLVPST